MAAGNVHLLQVVMNTAARLVTDTGRYEHITPVVRDILHGRPVQERIISKIAVLAFNCIHETGPVYFNDVCTPLADIPGRSSLRAADRGDLLLPATKTNIGSRNFRITAPTAWNSLPLHLRDRTINEGQFRSGLKTHSFKLAYQ